MAISVQIAARRYKALITITAGTPIFAAQGQTPILADRLLIQMLSGGAKKGLVYDDVPLGMKPAEIAAGGDLAVELAAASADGPGGGYEDAGSAIDLRMIAVDGLNSGDTVLVNAHLKV